MNRSAIHELCRLYYDDNKLKHAERVAEHTRTLCRFFKLPYDNYDSFVYNLGLAHDLYEDTDIKRGTWFDNTFENNLLLLTKSKGEDYEEYLDRIKREARNSMFIPAYIVKLADIWDHLNQDETLSPKKRDKYLKGLPHLL